MKKTCVSILLVITACMFGAVTKVDWRNQLSNLPYVDCRTTVIPCKGDGLTDDTSSIQLALNQCPNSQNAVFVGPCKVYVPRGVYLISSTLKFNQMSIILEGDGPGSGTGVGNPDRSFGTVFVACGAALSACTSFSGSNVIQLTMDDVNSYNSQSNHGWMHGVAVKNVTIDVEYNTSLVGLALYGLSNTPAFDNVIVSGGMGTSFLVTNSTGSSSSQYTGTEGLVLNNFYVLPGARMLQGGCASGNLTASAAVISANEFAWRSGKILMCYASGGGADGINLNTSAYLLLFNTHTYTTGGINYLQLPDSFLVDGVSFGSTAGAAINVTGVDCPSTCSGFLGARHYFPSDVNIENCIFEGVNTPFQFGKESASLSPTHATNINFGYGNTLRSPVPGSSPSVVNIDWAWGGTVYQSVSAYTGGWAVRLGSNTEMMQAFMPYDSFLGPVQIISNTFANKINVMINGQPYVSLPKCYQSSCVVPNTDIPLGTQMYCTDCSGSPGSVPGSGGTGKIVVSNGSSWVVQ